MDSDDEFCLKWNNHHSTFMTILHSLLKKEVLVDVTLAAEGKFIEAHRLVLCTCSDYFQDALRIHDNKHAFIFLNNVAFDDLTALVDYMYKGEVNVSQEQLPRFLATAEALRIKGLSEKDNPPSEKLDQILPSQSGEKTAPRKLNKNTNHSKTSTLPPIARQARPASQQLITPNLFVAPQTQVSSRLESSQNLNDSDAVTAETTEVNFISVNTIQDEADMDQSVEDGLGTLSKVWSMNQSERESWGNTIGILDGNTDSSSTQEETVSYTTPEPEPSIEYRQYMEQQLNNTNVDEDFLLSPSSSSHVKDKWATSFSTPGSAHSAIVKGKNSSSNNGSANIGDSLESGTRITCPNCGRQYSQKGSLNRHLKFECGIVPKFPCNLCSMRFRRAYKLTEHYNRIHGNHATNS